MPVTTRQGCDNSSYDRNENVNDRQPNVLCSTCDGPINDSCICCASCKSPVHGSVMCAGLPDDVIKMVRAYNGKGILFVCTKCRIANVQDSLPSNQSELFGQMFEQVKGLTQVVKELSTKVTCLEEAKTSNYAAAVASGGGNSSLLPPVHSADMKKLMRDEYVEMEERKKRVNSIFVRGLEASLDSNGAANKLSEVSNVIIGHVAQFSNIQMIKPGLFRMNIMSTQDRKNLLENSKNLKNTEFSNVFIRRDLTYLQRMELRNRRAHGQTNQPDNSVTATGNQNQSIPTVPSSNSMQD